MIPHATCCTCHGEDGTLWTEQETKHHLEQHPDHNIIYTDYRDGWKQ